MSDEEDDGNYQCLWGTCRVQFESAETLDQHVERDHIKAQKAAAAAAALERKEADKGVVCEWEACVSDKIYRDSWNLVTHVRYKHTHHKPFLCTHDGCGKRFVQLHQMKKHTKTPHSSASRAAISSSAPKPEKKRRRKIGESADDANGGEGDEDGVPLAARRARRATARATFGAEDVDALGLGGGDDDGDYVAELTWQPPSKARRAGQATVSGSSREEEAAAVLQQVSMSPVAPELFAVPDGRASPALGMYDSPARATPLSFAFDRAHGVVSPTSLLASNTRWYSAGDQSLERPSLWSPLPVVPGAADSLQATSAPTPPVPEAYSNGNTPVGLQNTFVPIRAEERNVPLLATDETIVAKRPIPSMGGRFLLSPINDDPSIRSLPEEAGGDEKNVI